MGDQHCCPIGHRVERGQSGGRGRRSLCLHLADWEFTSPLSSSLLPTTRGVTSVVGVCVSPPASGAGGRSVGMPSNDIWSSRGPVPSSVDVAKKASMFRGGGGGACEIGLTAKAPALVWGWCLRKESGLPRWSRPRQPPACAAACKAILIIKTSMKPYG